MAFENLRVRNVHAVVRYTPKMKRWTAKNRKDHIIGIQLDGNAYHDLGYQEFVLSGNCVYFFNQRDDFRVEVSQPGTAVSIHFTTYEDIDMDSFCIPIANSAQIRAILNQAEQAKAAGDELRLLSLLYRLCEQLNRLRERAYSPGDPRMAAAKAYMDAHFADRDCLKRATAVAGITSRRFGELFRDSFDVTPNRYIVMCRVERAKELLAVNGLSVGDVAERCGFSDVYYFSKVFKQICGVPPSRWK